MRLLDGLVDFHGIFPGFSPAAPGSIPAPPAAAPRHSPSRRSVRARWAGPGDDQEIHDV